MVTYRGTPSGSVVPTVQHSRCGVSSAAAGPAAPTRKTTSRVPTPSRRDAVPAMTDLRDVWAPDGARTEGSRAIDGSLAPARLEEVWPEVERRLLGLLRTHDVPRARAEDFVQEAA